MFRAAKDAVAAKTAQIYLNERIARYGKIEGLRIDSSAATLYFACCLHGEEKPVTVTVEQYRIGGGGKDRWIEFSGCRCERVWLENLLVDLVEKKPFPLPAWAAAALA